MVNLCLYPYGILNIIVSTEYTEENLLCIVEDKRFNHSGATNEPRNSRKMNEKILFAYFLHSI